MVHRFVGELFFYVLPLFVPVPFSILRQLFFAAEPWRKKNKVFHTNFSMKKKEKRTSKTLHQLLTRSLFFRAGVMKPRFFLVAVAACSNRARTSAFLFSRSSWSDYKWSKRIGRVFSLIMNGKTGKRRKNTLTIVVSIQEWLLIAEFYFPRHPSVVSQSQSQITKRQCGKVDELLNMWI